ncbi:hypothetical protein IFM89_016771 [Coptis chinensis]|uniref:pyruvate kinase n=1 Tax=Coptis chinensis TaxID=261450 RepID=A0A835H4D1_9MAGN|nr:hypothetical protein IFM89_016771 [Coptis chinensis]
MHKKQTSAIYSGTDSTRVLSTENGTGNVPITSGIEVDMVTEAEMKENGFRIGGMNVARINMCHGTHEWHRGVIEKVRRLNEEKGYAIAIMVDTQDGFAEDVKVGDELLVDGGMVRFEVIEKIGPDVKCRCTDSGLLLLRANLTFLERWKSGSRTKRHVSNNFFKGLTGY